MFCSSIQFASKSFGPIRKLRSTILSSSLTSVAVRPSLQWAWTIVKTRRNIFAARQAQKSQESVWFDFTFHLCFKSFLCPRWKHAEQNDKIPANQKIPQIFNFILLLHDFLLEIQLEDTDIKTFFCCKFDIRWLLLVFLN